MQRNRFCVTHDRGIYDPDELPPGSEGASPPRPCELVEGTIVDDAQLLLRSVHGATASPAADSAVFRTPVQVRYVSTERMNQ